MSQVDKERNQRAVNIWTARAVPYVLAGVVGYTTYVLVALLCVNYLLIKHNNKGAAIPILIIYFILFILMASAFLRVVYTTTFDPPYAPLGAGAAEAHRGKRRKNDDIAGDEYTSGDSTASQNDPDSPGLELFYTKDVFCVERDGKPRWCSECRIWKLDRQHHCRAVGRCIYKMDHYCPWVGGPIGENNFKFFIQFVGYTSFYCLHVLVVMAFYVHKQLVTKDESINRQFIAVLALAAFFGLFTGTMTSTSVKSAMLNVTLVEDINRYQKQHTLAILKPSLQRLAQINVIAASTQTYSEISYPLAIPPSPRSAQNNIPFVKTIRHDQLSQPVTIETAKRMAGLGDVMTGQAPEISKLDRRNSATLAEQSAIAENPAQMQHIHSSPLDGQPYTALQSPAVLSDLSSRDRQAVRTFAILETLKPGDNPWDLGSAMLNWETVMGTTLVDWFLPFRKSPCCNHENTESHFQVGPCVDRIRASVSFIPPTPVSVPIDHQRKERFLLDRHSVQARRLRSHIRDQQNSRKTDETELRDLQTNLA